jgi:hypothetical protein
VSTPSELLVDLSSYAHSRRNRRYKALFFAVLNRLYQRYFELQVWFFCPVGASTQATQQFAHRVIFELASEKKAGPGYGASGFN